MLNVELLYDQCVNYAAYLNRMKIIKEFKLTNLSEQAYRNVTLYLKSELPFLNTREIVIDQLNSFQSLILEDYDLQLASSFLVQLKERMCTEFFIEIIDSNHQLILKKTFSIDLLAFDEWGGTKVLPTLLASFITPNHPYITHIISIASDHLSKGFRGYQTKNRNDVTQQVLAIYNAIKSENIAYCVPPASFEEYGQKIRLPHDIAKTKLATCLDTALLFCACLEAVGLNSLLILVKGHAFIGFFTEDLTFSECFVDDVSALHKRISYGINEIILLEAVSVNKGQDVSFESAIYLGNKHLEDLSNFLYLIDIKRSRNFNFRPLPITHDDNNNQITIKDSPVDFNQLDQKLKYDFNNSLIQVDDLGNRKMTKLDVWQRKLLDLSLRNQLINFRIHSQSNIPLYTYDLHELVQELSKGREFQISPKPELWDKPSKDSLVFIRNMVVDTNQELLKEDFKQNRLRSSHNELDLKNALTKLYRNAKNHIEETGSNALYISIGMLLWYESDVSMFPRFSPIILIPVEMVRKSISGYVIRRIDEEIQINMTLLEMLRQDLNLTFPELNELPLDESGVDIDKILTIFRRKIMNEKNWDVFNSSYLNLFTFNKSVMYNDIKNRSTELRQNSVVNALIDQNSENLKANFSLDHLDQANVFCPLSYDSSQLSAILESTNDKSFILYGPPGTGKSQTITNMIVNALGHGKRVLFVAEKMAALNVVEKRLNDLGLADFCLELHSNKSRKKEVLEQLRKPLELRYVTSTIDYNKKVESVKSLKIELSHYVGALHQETQFGFTLYDVISHYISINKNHRISLFESHLVKEINKEQFEEIQMMIHDLKVSSIANKNIFNHPLLPVELSQYTISTRQQASHFIHELIKELGTLFKYKQEVTEFLELNDLTTITDYYLLYQLNQLLIDVPNTPLTLLNQDDFDHTTRFMLEIILHAENRNRLRTHCFEYFNDTVISLDLNGINQLFQSTKNKWFLPKYLTQRNIKKLLKSHIKLGVKLNFKKFDALIHDLIELKTEEQFIKPHEHMMTKFLGQLWATQNITECLKAGQWFINLKRIILDLTSISTFRYTKQTIYTILSTGINLKEKLNPYQISFQQFNKVLVDLNELLNIKDEMYQITSKLSHSLYLEQINQIDHHLDHLKDWCFYVQSKNKLIDQGFKSIISELEHGLIDEEEIALCFNKMLYQAIIEYVVNQSSILSHFSRLPFEDKIKRFKQLDEELAKLMADEVYIMLANTVPNGDIEASANSELGILQKAIRGGGRGLSLRTIFDKIPNLLNKLAPCMLMSPLSVAQYLDLSSQPFDLVIFDEASQMLTCDAIGAMARAKNVIIVGDPNQLPPTSFFSSTQDDEYDIELTDLESILDDCLALNMPYKHLLWHYRSKHESLIAFSNLKYYDNKLMTFPSFDDLNTKVKFKYIQGIYDRGGTRQNKIEAEAVVEELFNRLKNEKLNKYSVGIVTFNTVQQSLIEDLIDDRLHKEPSLETFFFGSEGVFVKNLENVQGDERDVILFSIGYGPDKHSKISMNFGPLNQEGGWRRLNVALSRARYEMIIFSSLTYENINLSKTNSKGVADFRSFLEYAEVGKIFTKNNSVQEDKDDFIVDDLIHELTKRGYQVVKNIGSSDYKISIGVIHPLRKDEYILGIECDGPYYKNAAIVRDREVLRLNVLKGLGWNMMRIYSIEYYENKQKEIQRIEDMIRSVLYQKEEESIKKEEQVKKPNQSNLVYMNKHFSLSKEYITTKFETSYLPDQFYQVEYKQKIKDILMTIIQNEGPISYSLLSKKVIHCFNMTRIGARIDQILKELLKTLDIKAYRCDYETFYYSKQTDLSHYRISEVEKRVITDISPIEILVAMKEVLITQISLPKEELFKETSKCFGFQKLGNQLIEVLTTTYQIGLQQGVLKEENGRISYSQ